MPWWLILPNTMGIVVEHELGIAFSTHQYFVEWELGKAQEVLYPKFACIPRHSLTITYSYPHYCRVLLQHVQPNTWSSTIQTHENLDSCVFRHIIAVFSPQYVHFFNHISQLSHWFNRWLPLIQKPFGTPWDYADFAPYGPSGGADAAFFAKGVSIWDLKLSSVQNLRWLMMICIYIYIYMYMYIYIYIWL